MDFAAQSPAVAMDINTIDLSTLSPHAQAPPNATVGNDIDPSSAMDTIINLPSIFDLLDLEANGDLDFAEFKIGLNSIGVALTHDEAIMLFESIDTENEEYINKDSFMEWLSKSKSNISAPMSEIRDKLIVALNAAQEINNPLQDMMDEDEIAHILGNKAEYIDEMEQIKKESFDNDSDGTFKVHQSEEDDDDEPLQHTVMDPNGDESDSLDSEERIAIQKAKIKQDSETAQDLETTLMEQQMKAMLDQEKYALEREISGRNTYREEDAAKWKKEEIENEFEAMNLHFRKLSQQSLSIDQVQNEVNKTMQEFRKLSQDQATAVTTPNKMDNVTLSVPSSGANTIIKAKVTKIKIKPPPIQTAAVVSLTPTKAKSPITEIPVTSHQHTTSSQPVMIDQQRRNSLSESYSMHGGMSAPVTDISHYTAQQQPMMREQLIMSRSISARSGDNNNHNNNNNEEQNIILRLIAWYLSPMHERASLHRLWYHGANAVLSFVICLVELPLFCLSLVFLPFCGAGLLFTYFQCLLSRHFAQIDSRFSYYFFGNGVFPRFSIFIPKSHEESVIGALKDYMTDPHMLQVIAYFTFIKFPAAFILSGIAMVIFSGVTSILLSPLIFWLDARYFEDDLYCLFGSRVTDPIHTNKMLCNGWAINSFGETFLAFLVFIPALPLTLHLSNVAAKMLCTITLNFLSINSHNSPPLTSGSRAHAQKQQNINQMKKKNSQNHRI